MKFFSFIWLALVVVLFVVDFALSVAIYRDHDVLKKSQFRGGKQLNSLSFYDNDDNPMSQSHFRESSRWESAEWPMEYPRGGDGDTYESEDRPYSWFYYNKYLTNGRYNHLYNGPQNDDRAGIGHSNRNSRPPQILPRPSASFRHVSNGPK